MKVVLGFHGKDAEAARDLLLWVNQLEGGTVQPYDLILIADGGVEWDEAMGVLEAGQKAFRYVTIISTETSVTGWPAGANTLFLKAAEHCQQLEQPFLWLEPDCVPLAKDWLTRIHAIYSGGFIGHIYDCHQAGLPARLLSGVAVYPPSAYQIIHPCVGNEPHRAWDVSAAEKILPHAHDCVLFQHLWGEKNLPPTFVLQKTDRSPVNALTLDRLSPNAVLFHRNKDRSLRRLIAGKLGLAHLANFIVVLPICNHDVDLMQKLLDWIGQLGGAKGHEALVSFDAHTTRGAVQRVLSKAGTVFAGIHQTSYQVTRGTHFPQTAAWQHAARTMAQMQRSWLWLEADCVPLKSGWLDALQAEYDRCGAPFCGPIVHGPDHCNGTAIYPANTPELLPRTMSHTNNAWDVECRDEINGKVHDSALWHLAWGVHAGRLDPVGGEELPSFPKGDPIIHQISRHAVIFHREKTGSLIDRLREQNRHL